MLEKYKLYFRWKRNHKRLLENCISWQKSANTTSAIQFKSLIGSTRFGYPIDKLKRAAVHISTQGNQKQLIWRNANTATKCFHFSLDKITQQQQQQQERKQTVITSNGQEKEKMPINLSLNLTGMCLTLSAIDDSSVYHQKKMKQNMWLIHAYDTHVCSSKPNQSDAVYFLSSIISIEYT